MVEIEFATNCSFIQYPSESMVEIEIATKAYDEFGYSCTMLYLLE